MTQNSPGNRMTNLINRQNRLLDFYACYCVGIL